MDIKQVRKITTLLAAALLFYALAPTLSASTSQNMCKWEDYRAWVFVDTHSILRASYDLLVDVMRIAAHTAPPFLGNQTAIRPPLNVAANQVSKWRTALFDFFYNAAERNTFEEEAWQCIQEALMQLYAPADDDNDAVARYNWALLNGNAKKWVEEIIMRGKAKYAGASQMTLWKSEKDSLWTGNIKILNNYNFFNNYDIPNNAVRTLLLLMIDVDQSVWQRLGEKGQEAFLSTNSYARETLFEEICDQLSCSVLLKYLPQDRSPQRNQESSPFVMPKDALVHTLAKSLLCKQHSETKEYQAIITKRLGHAPPMNILLYRQDYWIFCYADLITYE